jgi:hypothetical protein
MNISFKFSFTLIIVLGLFACQPSGPRQFEDPAFSFSYPPDWKLMSEIFDVYQPGRDYYDLGLNEIVMVTSAQKKGEFGVYFAVASAPLPVGSDLETVFRQTYADIADQLRDVSEQPAQLGDRPAYSITYQRPWGEPWWQFRDVWLEKDGTIYLLSFHAAPASFQEYVAELDTILDQFVLK